MAPTLPLGSLILVTSANGYLGSHITDQILRAGYRVRGTVRRLEHSSWIKDLFDDRYGRDQFELLEVTDLTRPNCLCEAIKGVSALAYVPPKIAVDPNPHKSVVPVVNAIRYALEAATGEAGCKSVVLTSSSVAITLPKLDAPFHITPDVWNESAIRDAWATSGVDEHDRPRCCYAASKAQGEQFAWEFVQKTKPHFTFNSVVPNANFGSIFNPEQQHGSSVGWLRGLYDPTSFGLVTTRIKPQWYIHVMDTAKMHLAYLTDLSLNGERLLAFAEPFNWNDVLHILDRLAPHMDLAKRCDSDERDRSTVASQAALEILQPKFGQQIWTSLEEGMKCFLQSFIWRDVTPMSNIGNWVVAYAPPAWWRKARHILERCLQ